MRKLFTAKKYFTIILIAFIAVAGLGLPNNIAHAQATAPINWYSCLKSPATCLVYMVSLTLNGFLGLFVSLGASLIRFTLGFNQNLYNSPLVQKGYATSLAIANLGFVLFIIVIALATILRREDYGVKKALWRLIVMAILVNFGLVITAPIVSFSDQLTQYFINSMGGSDAAFSTVITDAFAPQNLLKAPVLKADNTTHAKGISDCEAIYGTTNPNDPNVVDCANQHDAAIAQANGGASIFWQAIMSLLFSAVFMGVVLITYVLIGILFLVRYIFLAILLITLPFAWLSWVFPKFGGEFGRWWNNFIKWTFFAPAALFFIYLAFTTLSRGSAFINQVNQSGFSGASGQQVQTNGLPDTAIALNLGQNGFAQTALDEIALAALMIGGLMAASKITGKAGAWAVSQGKAVSNAVTGYVGKQTKKAARLGYQKAGGEKITRGLQEGRLGVVGKIPIVGGIARRGASLAGRGISSISGNEKLVEAAKKSVPKDREAVLARLKGSMNTEDTFAHLAEAVKGGYLKEGTIVNGKTAAEFFDQNRDVVKRFGQGKLLDDTNKLFLSDSNYRNAKRAIDANNGNNTTVKVTDDIKDDFDNIVFKAGEMVSAFDLMDTSIKRIVEKLSKEDAAKVDVNTIFGSNVSQPELTRRLGAVALYGPQLVSNMLKKMKSPTLRNINNIYPTIISGKVSSETRRIDSEKERVQGSNLSAEEKTRKINDLEALKGELPRRADLAQRAFSRGINNAVFSTTREEGEGGGGGGGAPVGGAGGGSGGH